MKEHRHRKIRHERRAATRDEQENQRQAAKRKQTNKDQRGKVKDGQISWRKNAGKRKKKGGIATVRYTSSRTAGAYRACAFASARV